MKTNLLTFVEAAKIIHAKDRFWIIDNKCDVIYSNNIKNNQLSLMQVVIGNHITGNLLDYLINLDKNHAKALELVVLSHGEEAPKVLLLDVKPVIYKDKMIGLFLVEQGGVNGFEHLRLLSCMLFGQRTSKPSPIDLTAREHEILYFISRGKSYKEIAEIISIRRGIKIALSTIANIVRSSLYDKFGVYNLIDLKKIAIKLNLVSQVPLNYLTKPLD